MRDGLTHPLGFGRIHRYDRRMVWPLNKRMYSDLTKLECKDRYSLSFSLSTYMNRGKIYRRKKNYARIKIPA